jgi:methyl-accepting chemotaxis protein
MITIVMILALSQMILIGVLAYQSEKSLQTEANNRFEIQTQQVDIQVRNYKNLINAMHEFTGGNIETNYEVAKIQFKKECGDYVEKVDEYLVCENGYIIEDTINENTLLPGITNIVRGESSIFIDLGEGYAKKISTTVNSGMYAYGYQAEPSMYNNVIVNENNFLKYTKIEGVYKTKACDPLKNKDDVVVGALCVGIDEDPTIDNIVKQVKEYKFSDEGIVYLIDIYDDRFGNVLAHPNFESGTNLLSKDYVNEIVNNKEGIIQYEVDGKRKIAAYVQFEPYDIIVVAENNLLEEQSIQTKQIIGLSVALLLISIIVSLVFSRTITGPIKKLRESADKVTNGEFDTQLPQLKSKDEIAELTASLEMLIMAFKFKTQQIEEKKSK